MTEITWICERDVAATVALRGGLEGCAPTPQRNIDVDSFPMSRVIDSGIGCEDNPKWRRGCLAPLCLVLSPLLLLPSPTPSTVVVGALVFGVRVCVWVFWL